MNILYDIFELADFPVVITDKNFVITYKNGLAAKLFCGFRRRSKISRYFRNFKNEVDFSVINELDIETGTQFMRALVLPTDENTLIFLFFTLLAFTDTAKFLAYVREKYSGDFIDFYCNACREYSEMQTCNRFVKHNIPERAYAELLSLMSFFAEKPLFIQEEVYNVSELIETIASKISKRLSVFGLKSASAEILEKDCYAKINLRIFCFVIFRMFYMAFRLSDTGKVQISVDAPRYSLIEICVFTETNLRLEQKENGDFTSLEEIFPEFSFEFDIFKRTGFFDNMLCFSQSGSKLKLHYNIKRDISSALTLRAGDTELRKKRINAAIDSAFAQIKSLFSKKH